MKLTRNAGEDVLPLLERAEEKITVYSPFISPKYAELLLEKSKDGVDVDVFTANTNANYHQKSLRILLRSSSQITGKEIQPALQRGIEGGRSDKAFPLERVGGHSGLRTCLKVRRQAEG
ncbi:hypothetical protein AKJ65_02150 [candidate division MSBL1 archaeon SCGC-AAA259E19]|uniref:Uncharacterized protein n=1 Tax=candidate division MSBL1 archaeon SCGC-AAA259E19 TaxID=1698264 RepID=A0A133ULZ6_9EURY|nr:hypothetical protein AKJ65_02150 [candidate division MSBL1 archaeon SCGC-AAA259E19]